MDSSRNKNSGNKLQKSEYVISPEILDDLSSRFIINIPEAERKDLIRVLFQIELAHWFYIDFYCKRSSNLIKSCGMREFSQYIFKHIPFLTPYVNDLDKIIEEWKDYKFSVPTYGAILLDEELSQVLLVQSYWSRSSWGFPKGKINKAEAPCHCAIREVYEETGYNITPHIDPNEYIEANIHEQMVRLYIIPGVSKETTFEPRTRNEIRAVSWFPLNDLPVSRKDVSLKFKTGISNNAFFMVSPFLRKLRQWIALHSQDPLRRLRRNRYKSCGDIETVFELSHEFIKMKDYNRRRTPEFISQVRNDSIIDCKSSSHANDEYLVKVDQSDLTIYTKGKIDSENNKKNTIDTTDCKMDYNEVTEMSKGKQGNLFKTEESLTFNIESVAELKKKLEILSKHQQTCDVKDEEDNQDTLLIKKDSYVSNKHEKLDIIKLSERIRLLEIKAWSSFKFNLEEILG